MGLMGPGVCGAGLSLQVKHLERFPSDSIAVALNNVFHFEQHDATTYRVISDLFKQYGVCGYCGCVGVWVWARALVWVRVCGYLDVYE